MTCYECDRPIGERAEWCVCCERRRTLVRKLAQAEREVERLREKAADPLTALRLAEQLRDRALKALVEADT